MATTLTPAYYIPHGGGPWPFLPSMAERHASMIHFLRGLITEAGRKPRSILVISGHWEAPLPTVSSRSDYSMLYDHEGFPRNMYALRYPAPGSPDLASNVVELLTAAGFAAATESVRGYDHGVFVPLMIVDPEATIPVVPLSLLEGLDPAEHFAVGRALAPLRRENVLIVGSGMSFHNPPAFYSGRAFDRASAFDAWLTEAVTGDPAPRNALLCTWTSAPEARFAHPREEHLMPLMVAAGAAEDETATRVFQGEFIGVPVSGFRFG